MRRLSALLIAAVLLLPAAPALAAGPSTQVVNGEPVAAGDAPWMVHLRVRVGLDTFVCGGSLVNARWVVTAGHCVTGLVGGVVRPDEVTATIGREDLTDTSDGEVRGAVRILRHPDYDDRTLDHDLALVELADPSTASVLQLADSALTRLESVGTPAVVSGYGLTGEEESTSSQLLAADLVIAADSACEGNTRTLCAGDLAADGSGPPANDSCNGDSGGPLVVDDVGVGSRQVGVVSYGPVSCGYESGGLDAGGYARLSSFTTFVRSSVPFVGAEAATTTEGDDLVVTVTRSTPAVAGDAVRIVASRDGAPVTDDLTTSTTVAAFTAGTTTTTATFATVDDDEVEPDEQVRLAITSDDLQVATPVLEVDLHDDDGVVVDLPAATVVEGDDGTTSVPVVLRLGAPASGEASVRVRTSGGTATTGVDVTAVDEVVRFASGATTATFDLEVVGDTRTESDETVAFTLSAPVGLVRGGVGTFTILDDDPEPNPEPEPEPEPSESLPEPDRAKPGPDPLAPTVTRVAGGDRVATALATSASLPSGSVDVVHLASSQSFPDALVGTPLAHRAGGPLLLTPPDRLDERVLAEIERVLADGGRVRLLGGEVALDSAVGFALLRADITWDRIAGGDRYATAALVADELGPVDRVLLATGRDFPDALAAGAAASAVGGAVLLTDGPDLPDATAAALAARAVQEWAVGGAAAAARPTATPIVGADRYATAALVAATLLPDTDLVGLASGVDFPDALAGGVDVAREGGVLLLTPPDVLAPATESLLASLRPARIVVYGGPAAVADRVVQAVERVVG